MCWKPNPTDAHKTNQQQVCREITVLNRHSIHPSSWQWHRTCSQTLSHMAKQLKKGGGTQASAAAQQRLPRQQQATEQEQPRSHELWRETGTPPGWGGVEKGSVPSRPHTVPFQNPNCETLYSESIWNYKSVQTPNDGAIPPTAHRVPRNPKVGRVQILSGNVGSK